MVEVLKSSPSPPPPGVPSPWERQFPDETIAVEKNKVSAAALGLVLMAVVQILIGILHMPAMLTGRASDIALLHSLVPGNANQNWGFAIFAVATLALIDSGILARTRSLAAAHVGVIVAAAGLIILLRKPRQTFISPGGFGHVVVVLLFGF